MTSAMYSAIGGLKTHMSNLGVIGNNIANVNTQAYKVQRMTFQDSMYTLSRSGSNGSVSAGGNNPSQIGYGAQIGSIDLNMSPSTFSPTGYGLDCMITGEGFFMVGDKETGDSVNGASDLANFELTRMGDFWVDAQGYICDRRGKCLYGFATVVNPEFDPSQGESEDNPKTIISTELVPLRLPLSAAAPPVQTVDGEEVSPWQEGDPVYNILSSSDKDNNNARSNFSVGDLVQKVCEYVNKNKFAYEGGGGDADTPGTPLTRTQIVVGQGTANGDMQQLNLSDEDLRELGLKATDNFNLTLTVAGGSIISVDSINLPTGYGAINDASAPAGADQNNAENTTRYGYNGRGTLPIPNSENMCVELTGMSISKEGAITGTAANGQIVTVGYVAIVNAAANDGVTHTDGYYYKAGEGSGNLRVSVPGGVLKGKYMNNKFVGRDTGEAENPAYAVTHPAAADAILGGGTTEIRNSGLEQSSTDIASEFANMILTQRGYQANTRIITVTDSMLEELVNMKR